MTFYKEQCIKNAKGIHSFRNAPDSTHQICTKCGCRLVITYKNSSLKTIRTYYDKYGNKLDGIPTECKGLYDLLNED